MVLWEGPLSTFFPVPETSMVPQLLYNKILRRERQGGGWAAHPCCSNLTHLPAPD
jgi:hypothetical protein